MRTRTIMRTRRESFPARVVTTLLVALLATVVGNASQRYNAPVVGNASQRYNAPVVGNASERYIDLTFSARGEAPTVESVTVTNLTHTDIPAVTLNGTATLRLNNLDAAFETGDVNGDGSVDVADIATIISVMANGSAGDSPASADVNGDGTVDVADIASVISIMASKSRIAPNLPLMRAGSPALQGANAVTMDFHPGDILRFEGKSGEMRTIVVNVPKRDHAIPFYFCPCKDAQGNTYPIVEAGGLLWMAEDLKCLKDVNLYYDNEDADWASAAQNKETTAMVMVRGSGNDDVYYTYAAARQSLPEGWSLPTLGELDAVVSNLGGYGVVGDKMQRAGDQYSFRAKRTSLPDSLQLRISPKGYIGEDGKLTDTNSGYILTGTREKRKALYMKITNGKTEGILTADGLPSYAAVHVRGVRPAPSAYADMIAKLGNVQAAARGMATEEGEKNMFTGEVNPYTGTPYGAYYTVDNSMKWMFADIKGQHFVYNQNFTNENHGIYHYDDTQFTQMAPADSWEKDENGKFLNITRLKKMCAQKMADGSYHTLKVTFDQSVRDPEVDNAWAGKEVQWLARDIENRPGSLILQEYGNQEQGFALQRTVTLPGTYTMVEVYGSEKSFSGSGNFVYGPGNNGNGNFGDEISLNEFYMKRLNLLAADFNQDGTDDIVVGFCNQWMVLDGTDYTTVLSERTFPSDCVRACVGDLDENVYADLGFIYQHNNQIHVRVLMDDVNKMDDTKNPDINAAASYAATLPVAKDGISSFLDIKFGDIANTGNSVLCLAVPFAETLNSTFYVLDRGAGTMLNQTYKLDEQSSTVRSVSRDLDEGKVYKHTYNYPNSTLAVVHTRGLGERPDVLLHGGLYRLGDNNQFVPVTIEGVKNNQIIDAVIPSDCVAVGRFSADLPDGYEQLAYLGHYYNSVEKSMFAAFGIGQWVQGTAASVCSNLLTPVPSNGTMKRKAGTAKASIIIGVYTSFTPIYTQPRFCAYFPAFCAPSYSDLDVRCYKFVSCQATISEPRIKYALAAAPYWAKVPEGYANAGQDYDYGDSTPSTEWTQSTISGSGDGSGNGTKASLIFGYEQENKVSVFGMEVARWGFDYEVNIGHEFQKSTTHVTTYTYESGCTAGRDNKVGLTMTPVWLYTYECVSSSDPDNIGSTLVCGAPSYPRDLELSETDYMLLRGDREDIPDLSTVFTHTPGNPLTYLNDPDKVKSTGAILWSNDNKNYFSTTGSDGTKFLSIEVTTENTTETDNTFNMDMSLVGFVGALGNTVKAGFGFGYNHKWIDVYVTGNGTKVTGTVPLPKSFGDVPTFDWNMCRYSVRVGGQEFPVVNYIVKNVRKGN